jgi:hypothetical protein
MSKTTLPSKTGNIRVSRAKSRTCRIALTFEFDPRGTPDNGRKVWNALGALLNEVLPKDEKKELLQQFEKHLREIAAEKPQC